MAHSPDQLQSHSVEEDDLEPQGLAGITGLLLHTGFIQLWMELRALGVLANERIPSAPFPLHRSTTE